MGKWIKHARDLATFMEIPEDDEILKYAIDEDGARDIVKELVEYQIEMGNEDLETVQFYKKELENE